MAPGAFQHADYMSAALANQADRSRVEKLLQQGQALVGEIAQWAQAHLRLLAERRAFDFTIGISEPLMTAFDVEGLTEVGHANYPSWVSKAATSRYMSNPWTSKRMSQPSGRA